MYSDNNWYGNRYILSKYCNLKSDTNALCTIQHGHIAIYDEENKIAFGKRTFQSFPALCWTQQMADESKRRGIKNVIPIGSTFYICVNFLKINLIKK